MLTKKNIIAAVVVSSLSCASAFAANESGKVTLMGTVSDVTCAVDINGTPGGTTVDTLIHKTTDFEKNVGGKTGNTVPMVVTLKNCDVPDPDSKGMAANGKIIITGNVAANGNENIFVGSDAKTGFIIFKSGTGTAQSDAVKNNDGVGVALTNKAAEYTFNVAMASTVAKPTANVYTAPITVSYATE